MMETMRFALTLTPAGEVYYSEGRVADIARRIAGEIELDPGGMIVMSPDVNAMVLKSGIIGWAEKLLKTWRNRFFKDRRVDEELKKLVQERGMDTGWSVGNLFKGRYMSKSGEVFNEKSFAVDIRGVPFDFVKKAAEVLRKKFDQEAVLVVDNDTGRTYLMD